MHAPYTLVQRSRKGGKPIYYVRFRGPDGERLPWRSSGQTSKSAARVWADEFVKHGLVPGNNRITLAEFTPRVWEWDSEYIRGKRARGSQIGRSHVAIQRSNMDRLVNPVLGRVPLRRMTRAKIEAWQLGMIEAKDALSPKTINNALSALKVVLRYAVDCGIISVSPAEAVGKLTERALERGVLTPAEVRRVLNPRNWSRSDLWLMTVLATTTGLRMGELRALRVERVHRDYIDVRESWGRYGAKEPKWNSVRKVPIGVKTHELVEEYIDRLSDHSPSALLFPSNTDRDRPVTQKPIDRHLYAAMRAIGIDEHSRKQRRLSFHGLRHFYVTALQRAGLSEGQVRALSGHSSVRMVELYTHVDTADFLPAVAALEAEIGTSV